MHHRPVLGVGVLKIASAHANHGGRCGFRRASCRALPVRIALFPSPSQTRPRSTAPRAPDPLHRAVRAVSVCRCWLSTISGPATEFACCHSRACPRNVASPVDSFSCASCCNHVRRPIAAQRQARPGPRRPGFRPPFRPRSAGPGCLHVAVRKGVARLLRYIHFLRRQLQAAILDARIQRQVQPLAPALIHRFAGRGAQRRLRLRAGLCRRLLEEHHMPIQLGRLHIGSARCLVSALGPGFLFPCSLVPLVPAFSLPRSLAPLLRILRKFASSRSPLAVCWAPVAVVCSIPAWPVPTSVRSAEPAPNVPVTSSAVIFAGTAAASPRRLSLVITTPPVP